MEKCRRVHFKKLSHPQKEHIKMWYFRTCMREMRCTRRLVHRAAISPEPAFSMFFSPEKKEGKATNIPHSLRQPPKSEILAQHRANLCTELIQEDTDTQGHVPTLAHRQKMPLAQLLLAVTPFHSARFCFIFLLVFHRYPLLSSGCRILCSHMV